MGDNETHVVVTMAVPSEPRKRPKAPATGLPSRGNNTISKYMSGIGSGDNQESGATFTGELLSWAKNGMGEQEGGRRRGEARPTPYPIYQWVAEEEEQPFFLLCQIRLIHSIGGRKQSHHNNRCVFKRMNGVPLSTKPTRKLVI